MNTLNPWMACRLSIVRPEKSRDQLCKQSLSGSRIAQSRLFASTQIRPLGNSRGLWLLSLREPNESTDDHIYIPPVHGGQHAFSEIGLVQRPNFVDKGGNIPTLTPTEHQKR